MKWEPISAEEVKAIRRELGLTQEQLAHRMGVSFGTVNKWENGRAQPAPHRAADLRALRREVQNPADRFRRIIGGKE